MVTVVTGITAFLYWRCGCYLSSDCLFCVINIVVNVGAGRKLLIWEVGGANLKTIYNLGSGRG